MKKEIQVQPGDRLADLIKCFGSLIPHLRARYLGEALIEIAKKSAASLLEFDMDAPVPVTGAIGEKYFSTAQRQAAYAELLQDDHRSLAQHMVRAAFTIENALLKRAEQLPDAMGPILQHSTSWPAAISIQPAVDARKLNEQKPNDAQRRYEPITKFFDQPRPFHTQDRKRRTIWQQWAETVASDIAKEQHTIAECRQSGLPWLLDFEDEDGVSHQMPPDPPETGDLNAWCRAIRYYLDLHFAPNRDRLVLHRHWLEKRKMAVEKASLIDPLPKQLEKALAARARLPNDRPWVKLVHQIRAFPFPVKAEALIESDDPAIRRRLGNADARRCDNWGKHGCVVKEILRAYLRMRNAPRHPIPPGRAPHR